MYFSFFLFARQEKRKVPKEKRNTLVSYALRACVKIDKFGFAESICSLATPQKVYVPKLKLYSLICYVWRSQSDTCIINVTFRQALFERRLAASLLAKIDSALAEHCHLVFRPQGVGNQRVFSSFWYFFFSLPRK